MSTPVFNQNPTVGNRPFGRKDAQSNLIENSYDDLAFQGIYAGNNLTYKGFARPGAATSDPVWQISMMTYDEANNLLTVVWPENLQGNASNDYEFVWDDYADYTYV